nr:sulfotransferase [Salinibacter ruber]
MSKAGNRGIRKIRNTRPLWTPRQLYIPLEEVKIESPVFFLGVQGGGLTLITRMLRRSGDFVTIGGGPSFWTGNDEMDKFHVGHELLPDEMALRSPGYHNMTGREKDHPVFGLERSWVYATDELLPYYRMTSDDYSGELEREFKNFIRRSIRAYSTDGRSARFLDMSQSYTLKVPLLRTFFPDARFVLVSRDPYVMCWREVTRQPNRKYRLWNERPSMEEGLRLAAQHWRNSYETALQDLESKEDGIVVRFEEALSHPDRTVRRVSDHVGVSYDEDMTPKSHHTLPAGSKAKTKWYPIREGVNEKYKSQISTEEAEIIEREINNIDEKLGYK